jgi:hypothetical protein
MGLLLAIFATLLTAESVVMGLVFVYIYGKTAERLSLSLAFGYFGVACLAATSAIMRYEHGIPCLPQSVIVMRLTGVIVCDVLVTYSFVTILALFKAKSTDGEGE